VLLDREFDLLLLSAPFGLWGFKTPIVFEEAAGNEGRVNLKLWCSQLASGGGEGSAAGPAR
jgi:hypothetical protein